MGEEMFNSDQHDYVASLARIPREDRYASLWHHTAEGEECRCDELYARMGWPPKNAPQEAANATP